MRKPYFWAARNAWYVRVTNPNGKLSNRKLSDDKDEAFEVWESMVEHEKRLASSNGVQVGDIIDLYLVDLEQRVADGSLASVTLERRAERLALFMLYKNVASMPVVDLRVYHVKDWVNSKPNWGATTKHHAAEAVKGAFKWAFDEGRIDKHPVNGLSVAKGDPRDFLISEDLHGRLLDGAMDHRGNRRNVRAFRTFLMAMRMSGCRPSEIVALTIEQLDDTWVYREHKTRRKTKRARVVYPSPCLETLAKISAGRRSSGPVFLANHGEPWTYQKVRRRFERLKKRIEAPAECVLMSYRHSSITDCLVADIEISKVAEMHGTSVKMIQKTYGHLCQHQQSMKDASHKLAKHRRKAS
ncbi:MAG: tyrosine-type recombinase/integrase [Planctomycetota bacterium]